MFSDIEKRFAELKPATDFCSLRVVDRRDERIMVRQDVLQPVMTGRDAGAMITVLDGGGMGYAATADLSLTGLKEALDHAKAWARRSAGRCVVDY